MAAAVASASVTYSSVPPGSVNGSAIELGVPKAAPAAMSSTKEVGPYLPAQVTLQQSSQAAGELPAGADRSLANYEALYVRLGSIDSAVLTKSESQVMAILGALRGGESTSTRRTALSQDEGAAAEVAPAGGTSESEGVSGADALTQLLVLFMNLQAQLGRTATTLRSNALAEKMARTKEAADKIREQADATMTAALLQGGMSIASGAVQVGMGLHAAAKIGQAAVAQNDADRLMKTPTTADMRLVPTNPANPAGAASPAQPATPAANSPQVLVKGSSQINQPVSEGQAGGDVVKSGPTPEAVSEAELLKGKASIHLAEAQSTNNLAQGMGSILTGTGTVSGAIFTREAQMLSADQKLHELATSMSDQTAGDAQATDQHAQQGATAALNAIQSALQARVQADRTVYHVA